MQLKIYRCQQHWITCNFIFVYNLHYLGVLFIFIGLWYYLLQEKQSVDIFRTMTNIQDEAFCENRGGIHTKIATRNVLSTFLGGWVFQLNISSVAIWHFLKSQTNRLFFILLSVKADLSKIQKKSKVCDIVIRLWITKYLNDYACFLRLNDCVFYAWSPFKIISTLLLEIA